MVRSGNEECPAFPVQQAHTPEHTRLKPLEGRLGRGMDQNLLSLADRVVIPCWKEDKQMEIERRKIPQLESFVIMWCMDTGTNSEPSLTNRTCSCSWTWMGLSCG